MKKRRIAALAAAGALVLAGCGSQATSNTTGGADGTAQQTRTGGPDFSALAKALGVSTTKLQAAMQKLRPAQGQGSTDDMATKLAKELGLSTAKVKAALAKYMPQGGPPQGAAPSGTPTNS
jgi:hypothetical protein